MLNQDTMRKVLGRSDLGFSGSLAGPAFAGAGAAGSSNTVPIGSFKEQPRAYPDHSRRGSGRSAYHDEAGSFGGFLPGVGPTESELRFGALLSGFVQEVVGAIRKVGRI